MLLGSAFLVLRPLKERAPENGKVHRGPLGTLVEVAAIGSIHNISYNPVVGVVASLFVGYLSSLLGIGGGIIHVPMLVELLNFPVHIATVTSHFILAIMALMGSLVHLAAGAFYHGVAE